MLIIGITGGTGCGKTTLVTALTKRFTKEEVMVLSQDDYYKKTDHLDITTRKTINFDHPDAIDFDLLAQHLEALRQGKTIQRPVYSFTDHNRMTTTVSITPCNILIVEGILLLSQPQIRTALDLSIFIDVAADERLLRRLKRDTTTRGRTMDEILDQYVHTIKPMHERYIAPTKEFANLIITNNNTITNTTTLLQEYIQNHLD